MQKSLDILLSTETAPYELLRHEFTRYQNQPAIDFVVKKNDKEVNGQFILSGTTLYRLMISYLHAFAEKMTDNQFLDSFQITQNRKIGYKIKSG